MKRRKRKKERRKNKRNFRGVVTRRSSSPLDTYTHKHTFTHTHTHTHTELHKHTYKDTGRFKQKRAQVSTRKKFYRRPRSRVAW